MFKNILFISSLSLLGCATLEPAPREDLQDIFTLAKIKKFDEAEERLKAMSNTTAKRGFLTYSGDVIPTVSSAAPDDAITLLREIRNQVENCEEKTKEIKRISLVKQTALEIETDEGEDSPKTEPIKRFRQLQKDFTQSCIGHEKKQWSVISKIKKYAEVDMSPLLQESTANFAIEVSRINTEVDIESKKVEKEANDKVIRKNNYENSEEFYALKLCEMQSIVKAATSIIERENEAGKVSGFVDKKRMYEAGQAITINNKRIGHFRSEYNSKFGKNWNPISCK